MLLRKALSSILFFSSLFIYTFCFSQERQKEKPNFIIILADDLGYADLSINGSKQIPTPNIDALAKSGAICTNGYVSSAVCSPSRAGLLTGINQVSFGYDNNLGENQPGFDPNFLGLPIEQKTIADHLKPLGYTSGLIGKWHLGYEPRFHPLKRGFDEFWGYTGGGHDYFESKPDGKGYKSPIECNYKKPETISYITDDVGTESVGFIERHKNEPFFLYAAFNAPHAPMQALEEDLKLFTKIKDEKRRTYAAMVYRLDINVGRIIQALEKNNLSENTVVVFLSDNGGPVDSNASINAPFNGQKGILLEGGIHVPFFVKFPKAINSNQLFENPVSSLDLAATFYSLASENEAVEFPFEGKNLIPFLTNSINAKPHDILLWKFTISAAIREDNWKLIRLPDRLPMLFNLDNDISEKKDLALVNPEKTKEMLKKLGDWDVRLPHPVFLEGAEWKKRQLGLYDAEYPLFQPE